MKKRKFIYQLKLLFNLKEVLASALLITLSLVLSLGFRIFFGFLESIFLGFFFGAFFVYSFYYKFSLPEARKVLIKKMRVISSIFIFVSILGIYNFHHEVILSELKVVFSWPLMVAGFFTLVYSFIYQQREIEEETKRKQNLKEIL